MCTGDVALPSSGYSPRSMKPGMANHSGVAAEAVDHTLGLGELAGLTITNEAGPLSDVSILCSSIKRLFLCLCSKLLFKFTIFLSCLHPNPYAFNKCLTN